MLIMSILVSIVVMPMIMAKNKVQQAACKANLRTIDAAIMSYEADDPTGNGTSPANLNDLVPDYIKSTFSWQCPGGPMGLTSTDYRDNYDSATGNVSCPRASHNL